MTYEPLHHKYRPQTFAELVGQEAIATTLGNALLQRRIAPAYLFTGARGTGKTSSARIFAKSLNCLTAGQPTDQPCGTCEVCQAIARGSALDVIEIDAASNTGVDNIRELIERAQFAPVQCRYKVYVIDEVHMLSVSAFNALLKTLEEPPDRVVFVLATTDPQKVLPTIISRCQRFDFRRIPLDAMVAHLQIIAAKEAIPITPEAVHLVSQISQGGLRDAESLLDQLSLLEGEITPERVWDLVGAVPERDLMDLIQAIATDDPATVLDRARNLMDRGREPLIVLQNLASFYRDLLIAKTAPTRQDLVAITPPTWAALREFAEQVSLGWIAGGQQTLRSSEVQVKNTSQPRLWLEVTLLGLLPSALVAPHPASAAAPIQRGAATPPPAPRPAPSPAPPPSASTSAPPVPPSPVSTSAPPVPSPPPAPAPAPADAPPPAPAPAAAGAAVSSPDMQQTWLEVLQLVQPFSTQTMLRQQCFLVSFNGTEARVGTRSQPLFKMAKDRLPNIEAAFQQYGGHPVRVTLEVNTVEVGAAPTVVPPPNPSSPAPERSPAPTRTVVTPPPERSPQPSRSPAPSPAPSPTPPPGATALPPPGTTPDTASAAPWLEEDEVIRAAKSLAQMFNGQMVNLDGDEVDLKPGVEILTESEDEDDDVPF